MQSEKKRRFHSIKYRLTFWISLQILIPIFFISILSAFLSVNLSNRNAVNYTQNLLIVIRNEFEAYLDEIFKMSQDLLYNEDIYDSLMTEDYSLLNEPKLQNMFMNCLSRAEINGVGLEIAGKYYKSEKHRNALYEYDSVIYRTVTEQARLNGNKPYWYIAPNNNSIANITYTRILHHPRDLSECGVLTLSINAVHLFSAISNYNIENLYTFSYITSYEALQKSDAYADENGIFREGSIINIFTTIPEINIKLICRINSDTLYSGGYIIIRYIAVLTLFSILFLMLFMYHIDTQFITPLSGFINTMNNWQESIEIDNEYTPRNDEISELYKTFNKMNTRINDLIKKNYLTEITKKNAEIKMLQSQINPHFLFNTLESVNCMAQLYNVPEISNMITALSDIIGQTINRSNELIPLSKEIGYAEDYLYILKTRFGDKIMFRKEIDEAAAELLIPALIIQPIIENSFEHSISKTKKHCTIVLTARLADGNLYVDITDDGPGISADMLTKLNESFSSDKNSYVNSSDGKHSIGLWNINRRLKLVYGTSSGLFIEHTPEGRTVVHISIKSISREGL
ncbi:MAG: histidine kinase [Clostridia bacterium]|nr:histidine kinase [Clostridia bacterium]